MNASSIQIRLTVWYTLLISVATLGFGAYTYFSLEHRLYDVLQTMLAQRILHLREDVAPLIGEPQALARKIADIYSPEQNDRFIRISHVDDSLLYTSGMPHEHSFDPRLIPPVHDYTSQPSERLRSLRHEQHILLVGLKTSIAGRRYVLEMGTAITPVETALHKLIVTLLLGLPVLVIIAATGGALLVRRALRPVEVMRGTAEQISFGKLHQRLPLTYSGDAIDQLALTLNQMLDRLDQAYQQASRFSADASHELRTPLTIMRGEMESILHERALPPGLREHLVSLLEEAEHLSAIVEGLFSLARLDAGEAQISHETFDFAELARSTFEQMQLLAEDKHLAIQIEAPQPVLVSGDAARLKQVIVNLLDNAIKYTLPGGRIRLDVYAEGAKAVLSVQDNGIGISAEDLPHVFKRFYRADKVHSRTVQGAGLGLSIVQAICQAHGGSVTAASQPGIGTKLSVFLPLGHPSS